MTRDRKREEPRAGRTEPLGGFLVQERGRLFDAATPQRREQLRAAECRRSVYAAWNEVCASTREGRHVTGLKYLPGTNELLVYVEAGPWTTELTMLREIIRARMERAGAKVDNLIFKTSREGYRAARPAHPASPAPDVALPSHAVAHGPRAAAPRRALSPDEEARLAAQVAPIEDERLKEALKKAMKASLEWKKGAGSSK